MNAVKSAIKIGFLQALGLAIYITLVAFIIQNGNKLFGPINNFWGPILFLTLFSFSVLICGFIALGYPVKLFWIKKNPNLAIKIVAYTTGFLFIFLLIIFGVLLAKF